MPGASLRLGLLLLRLDWVLARNSAIMRRTSSVVTLALALTVGVERGYHRLDLVEFEGRRRFHSGVFPEPDSQ